MTVRPSTDCNITSYSYAYDPYGLPTLTGGGSGNGPKQNPYLFKGGIQDRGSGFVKFGQRWYNPATGTWTQQDTLDAPLDPANANRYAYAGDDPINNLDPAGLAYTASQCHDLSVYIGRVALLSAVVGGLGVITADPVLIGLGVGGGIGVAAVQLRYDENCT